MAGLTTHVLDTTRGRPAARRRDRTARRGPTARELWSRARETNADGRTDAPLMRPADARVGAFELTFHVGAYFRAQGAAVADPPFLDVVPIRFADRRPEGALPRAAGGDALELFDLSRKLTASVGKIIALAFPHCARRVIGAYYKLAYNKSSPL